MDCLIYLLFCAFTPRFCVLSRPAYLPACLQVELREVQIQDDDGNPKTITRVYHHLEALPVEKVC